MLEVDKENNNPTPESTAKPMDKQAAATENSAISLEPELDDPSKPRDPKVSTPAPEMSKGEKLYNNLVYKGLNYWTVLGVSLYYMDHFSHGKGRPTYDKWMNSSVDWLKKANVDKRFGEKVMMRAADVAVSVGSINFGGNLLLIPLKLIEDRKRPIVHWMNEKIYHIDQRAPDGHLETPDEIYIEKEQPKQSWSKVIARRLLAMSSTIVTGVALDAAFKQKLDEPKMVDGNMTSEIGGKDRFTNLVQNGVNKALNSVGGQKIVNNATFQRYLSYAALDSFFTAETATVMNLTNGAKKVHLPKEISKDNDPAGILATDEIVNLPEGTKFANNFATARNGTLTETPDKFTVAESIQKDIDAIGASHEETMSSKDDHLSKYKKKTPTAATSHLDHVKSSEASLSLT